MYQPNTKSMFDPSSIILLSDQPTTCPKCGARTDFENDPNNVKRQFHQCLNLKCSFQFIAEDDDDTDEDYL